VEFAGPVRPLPGGITPPEEKALSSGSPIRPGPLPAALVLPLVQHLGAPAEPCVAPGDRVLGGQVLARPDGPVSAAVHAPTSGRVVAVEPRPVPHPSGLTAPCVVLEVDGDDRFLDPSPLAGWRDAPPEVLLEAIAAAGVAGLGGAGFPTAVKAAAGGARRVDTLVLDAAECEPYITADDRLLRERAGEVLAGAAVLARLLRPERILIGIEDNKPEAIEALRAAADDVDPGAPLTCVVVPTRYPSGGERQLVELLTGREVPAGGLPADVGVLCQNVATAAAVHRAVARGEPLVSRITTVTGRAVARPGNVEVRLGTAFADLLADAGLDASALDRLLMGGPMMGFTIEDPSVPVVKTTNCLLAATAAELPPAPPARPCIRCGFCAEVCPASLLPQQLYWHARSREFDAARELGLADCIECGACAWVCPSTIPLVQYYRFAKGELREAEREREKAEHARERFEARQARQAREAAERAERRRARRTGKRAPGGEADPESSATAASATGASATPSSATAAAAPEAPATDARERRAAAVEAAVARARARRERDRSAEAATLYGAAEDGELARLGAELADARRRREALRADGGDPNVGEPNLGDPNLGDPNVGDPDLLAALDAEIAELEAALARVRSRLGGGAQP
jgi:electron transport complex protein RnfC